jgi:hypothetical protein
MNISPPPIQMHFWNSLKIKKFFSRIHHLLPHSPSPPFTEKNSAELKSHAIHLRLVPRHHPQPYVLRILRLPDPRQDRPAALPGARTAIPAEGSGLVR